jgi:hypothetical protein
MRKIPHYNNNIHGLPYLQKAMSTRSRWHNIHIDSSSRVHLLWTICWIGDNLFLLRMQKQSYLRFYVPLKNFSLIWGRHHCWWRAAKFRPMLGAHGLWAGGIFIVPHLLWHGTSVFLVSSEGPSHSVASFTTHEGMWRINCNPNPHGAYDPEELAITRLICYFHIGGLVNFDIGNQYQRN